MFGSNTVQSSWANPQQNQSQQQSSGFGQPSGFGAGTGFGSTGAFGQPQQPQTNPMFGNLANPSTGTSAFGGFGQNPPQPAASTSAFGAPKPATGLFGGAGTSAFGSGGNTFGSTAGTGTTVFGSNATTGGAFSSFGQNRATTGFGVTSPTTGNDTTAPVTTGTSNPPYSSFSEKDPTSTSTLQYQTITAMPAYRGTSLEELRYQDYQQGRKTAGAFGQPSFSGTATTQPTNLFGGAPPTQPASTSIFGGSAGAGTGAFGNTGTTGNAGTGFGTFAQPQPAQPATGTGTGVFGSTFGQPQQQQQQQQQQQPSAFSSFGQPQQPAPAGTSIFGGTFGQQNKPATGFGSGAFGSTSGAFGSTGTFGQPAGQPTAGTTGIFGQPQQQPAAGSTFGGFGSNTAAKPSIFGQPAQTGTTSTSFGAFGNQQQQQQPQQPQQQPQQPQAGGLFGNPGGGLFGQPQQQQQPQQTGLFGSTPAQPQGSIFGAPTTGGGLFGNVQQNQQQAQQPAQQGGLFAPKPAAGGGLFGNTFGQTGTTGTIGSQPQTNLFGQPAGQITNQQSAAGTNALGASLFGPKPAAPGLGTSTSTGGSLFGNGQSLSSLNASATVPGAQGTLFASIAEPLSQNLPIFSMLPPGPRAVDLDQQPKKKPGFFVDVPTRSPVPYLQLGYTPANSKLRGFATSTSGAALGSNASPFATSLTNGKSNALALSRLDGKGPDGLLGRSSSPSLGSGGRQSVKKLILDKKVEPADLFSQSGSRASPGRVTFSPALSQAAREKEVAREKEAAVSAAPAASQVETSTLISRKVPGRFSAQSTINVLGSQPASPEKEPPAPAALQHGSYWVKPDLPTLVNLGYEDLVAFKNLVVGRVGYGEIQFLEPVDLTNLPRLGALLGEIVKFDDKECSVYPDTDDADKPAPGSGLNVRARIVLVRCWATDKATREPIKNEKDPGAVKHLKRLKTIKETHFEDFDIREGKWTFSVDHF
ncbi:nucleoporin autopeptidase-domain-containing protein [Suillus bovinus]|uniref:nucleoporin autopeptidase-domain-containing protein n=1 Tax=Suillus bovinus TaxID=48563 RepID=UPI001B87E554|nr:nucleoporin autopeptidase-domain-containing protein [Suillus bovinus]KAG2155090.1 nucleoporin autopeptidase-domain-containing protein [Suillus bovinus]